MFLRPEEVVLASSATSVDDGCFGQHQRDHPIHGFDMDTVGAVGTGVFQLDAVFAVLAVDQQQEVDRSRYAEAFIAVQRHGMERESQAVEKPLVVVGQGVIIGSLAVGKS